MAAAAEASAWAHVVRHESDPAVPPPEPSDRSSPSSPAETAPRSPALLEGAEQGGGNGNAGGPRGRKLAWSLPSNGSSEAGSVMGAESWPPLSGCTARAAPKPSSEPPKVLPDGSPSAPPGHVIASPPPPPLKPTTNTLAPNPAINPAPPVRHKPMKRSSGPLANGGPTLPLPPPAPAETPHAVPDKHAGSEPSPKNNVGNSNWDHSSRGSGSAPQVHGGSDHHRGYGGNRRGSGGGGYGSRRDPERGAHEWNQSRSFGGRDMRMQPPPPPRGVHRPFIGPPPPVSAPFMGPPLPPPPVRPFISPMVYQDIASPVFYFSAPPEPPRGATFATPAVAPIMLVPPPDHRSILPQDPRAILPQDYRAMLVHQINYYFSPENLCKDVYLRQKMDDEGWVPISVIAGFNRVKSITSNTQYILDAIRASEIVEVQGDKVRKRDDWRSWLLHTSPNQYGSSGLQPPTFPNHDAFLAQLQNVVLQDGTTNNIATGAASQVIVLNRSGSGNFINQFQGNDSIREWSTPAHKESGQVNTGRILGRSDTL